MGPREECSLHPSVRLHPHFNLKARSVDVKEVAERETHTSSILRLQPDRVQCMVCHKCGLCCAARKHEVGTASIKTHLAPIWFCNTCTINQHQCITDCLSQPYRENGGKR